VLKVYTHTHTHTLTHIHSHTNTHTHTCMYVCVCVCVFCGRYLHHTYLILLLEKFREARRHIPGRQAHQHEKHQHRRQQSAAIGGRQKAQCREAQCQDCHDKQLESRAHEDCKNTRQRRRAEHVAIDQLPASLRGCVFVRELSVCVCVCVVSGCACGGHHHVLASSQSAWVCVREGVVNKCVCVYMYAHVRTTHGLAANSRLLKIIGFFCKRALYKRR